jgi:hypothetical protein
MHASLHISRLALATAIFLFTSSAGAQTLDQSVTGDVQSGSVVGSGFTIIQTFTAGRTGKLERVDLYLSNLGATEPLTLEVTTGLDGTTLATTSVPASAVVGSPEIAWVTFQFAAPADIVAGTQYALRLSSGTGFYAWWGSESDPYSGGMLYTIMFGTVNELTFSDFFFKTYVRSFVDVPAALADVRAHVEALDPATDFTHSNLNANEGRKNALLNKLNSIANLAGGCDIASALGETASFREKFDGGPDDWLSEPAAGDLRTLVDGLATALRTADCDGDGTSNGNELLLGTDPGDASSHP